MLSPSAPRLRDPPARPLRDHGLRLHTRPRPAAEFGPHGQPYGLSPRSTPEG